MAILSQSSPWAVLDQPILRDRLKQLKIPIQLFDSFWLEDPQAHRHLTAVLEYRDGKIQLRPLDKNLGLPLVVEWGAGKIGFRMQRANHEAVVKAVIGRSKATLKIVDATAGLGRDSVILAAAGLQVTALERHPLVFTLLKDGWDRAQTHLEARDILSRLDIVQGDAQTELLAISTQEKPDVVYLDPMFPDSARGSAQVKKDMRLFRDIIGHDEDTESLLATALHCAQIRVVVKRPRKSDPIKGPKPSSQLLGKSNRFDVYAV